MSISPLLIQAASTDCYSLILQTILLCTTFEERTKGGSFIGIEHAFT